MLILYIICLVIVHYKFNSFYFDYKYLHKEEIVQTYSTYHVKAQLQHENKQEIT